MRVQLLIEQKGDKRIREEARTQAPGSQPSRVSALQLKSINLENLPPLRGETTWLNRGGVSFRATQRNSTKSRGNNWKKWRTYTLKAKIILQ